MNGAVVQRDNRLLALAVAAALHVALLAYILIVPAKPMPLPVGSSVPINIVSSEPTDVRPAVQAPQTEVAAAPQPVPEAPPTPPAPTPAPTPSFTHTPPKPAPAPPKPQPAAAQPSPHAVAHPQPQPAQARPAPPRQAFDINRLQQIIQNAQRNAGPPASSAPRGPPRQETAPQPRPDAGHGVTQSDLVGLSQLLERLWTLQCDVGGVASTPTFKVRFVVDLSGNLLGQPTAQGLERSGDPVTASVARRALDAVHAVFPLPPQYYGQTVTVNFNAKEACSRR